MKIKIFTNKLFQEAKRKKNSKVKAVLNLILKHFKVFKKKR